MAIVNSKTDSDYSVSAVSAGTIVYKAFNGAAAECGYGYTVILDHGNGAYTLYAHLATIASSGLATAVGTHVTQGSLIGYMAAPSTGEMSSGNVLSRTVAPTDKIQLHFERFTRAGPPADAIAAIASLKVASLAMDPTKDLVTLGYIENTPAEARPSSDRDDEATCTPSPPKKNLASPRPRSFGGELRLPIAMNSRRQPGQ